MQIDKNKNEEREIKRYLSLTGKRVLEIGCGGGRLSIPLAWQAKSYIGIDIDKKAILRARKNIPDDLRGKLTFKVASGDKTGLLSESVDTVFMILAIHEVAPGLQGRTMMEAHRVLKKGGQLLIAEVPYPTQPVQSLYNVVYRIFLNYQHDFTVKHSKWVIENCIKGKLFKLVKKSNYTSVWEFDSLRELTNFMMIPFKEEVKWSVEKEKILEKELKKMVGVRGNGHIVFEDHMDIYDLRKEN